ncbi:hypothetical protein BDR07DRAFT_133966 [Suillus spraguei]|nr:hypothetical protein BDR07DRAFT_133966 [Suillus spraguei]
MLSFDVAHHQTSPFQKDAPKRGFLSRRARSNLSEKLGIIKPKQPVPERKVGEHKSERGEHVDGVSAVSTLAQCHLNSMVVSAILHMIRLASWRIKANSEIIHLPIHRAQRLMIALSLPTWIAKIVWASGNDSCRLEAKISHSAFCIPALHL